MKIDLSRVQKILEWVKSQIRLDALSGNAKTRIVKRGQVYRCNFGCGVGSEMQKDRPAVIMQNDPSNKSSGNTIIIPVTHDNSIMSCIVPLTKQYDQSGNILLDGQANTSNIMCVSKARLGDYICDLPKSDMENIEIALAKSVDLMRYYADLEKKYKKKLAYIESIKKARNAAQDELNAVKDELSSIRNELGISADESIIEAIRTLKEAVRKSENS